MRPGIILLSLLVAPEALGDCERVLGLDDAPIADLLLARPTVDSLTFVRTTTPTATCTVEASLELRIPSNAELDWLDLVLSRDVAGETLLESSDCALVIADRSMIRLRVTPGERYTVTVAAFDVEGRKSEPVNLEIVAPGLGSAEWRAKAPYCRDASTGVPKAALGSAAVRQPWPRAIAGAAGGIGLAWLLFALLRPRKRPRDTKRL